MPDFPSWFTETIQRRIEILHKELKQDKLIQIEQAGFDVLFLIFIKNLDKDRRAQFLQLEELWTRVEGLEMEWIYKQGVKDGVKLMISML